MTKEEAIKYLQQLYPNGGHCWLDEQRIGAISMAIEALKEEPVSEDLEQAAKEYADEQSVQAGIQSAFIAGGQWQKQQMMKNAVDVGIDSSRSDGKTILSGNFFRYNTGDKVKIIIVKED